MPVLQLALVLVLIPAGVVGLTTGLHGLLNPGIDLHALGQTLTLLIEQAGGWLAGLVLMTMSIGALIWAGALVMSGLESRG